MAEQRCDAERLAELHRRGGSNTPMLTLPEVEEDHLVDGLVSLLVGAGPSQH